MVTSWQESWKLASAEVGWPTNYDMQQRCCFHLQECHIIGMKSLQREYGDVEKKAQNEREKLNV